MAINLSGFLGGLGEGFGAYQKERLVRDQTKFERDSELERQRLARLADARGQEAIDRQAKAEERLQGQAEYNQGLGIFNQIQEIAKADADDDVTTGRFLRSPGLDEASRQQEVQGRLQRYNQRQTLIKTLSGQGKVTQTFGDVSTLLRPTQFGTPDFKMPKPMIDPVQLRTMTDTELAKIYKAPTAQKADAVAQARQRIGYYADDSYLDANLPNLGTSMGFGAARQPARPLENPQQFFQQNPMFAPGVGGERTLGTGAKQVVKYVNGQPVVEYQPELKANYVSPEADTLKSTKLRTDIDILRRSADAKVNQEFLKAEGLRWKNLLSEKAYNWFDATQRAKISGKAKTASSASDALRKMSIMLAHQDRMAALGLRREEYELDKEKNFQAARLQFEQAIRALEQQKIELGVKSGAATDDARGGTRQAAIDGIKKLDAEIARMTQLGTRVAKKDINAANQVLGGQFAPANTLDATQMYADQQSQREAAILAAQMGMGRPQVQQVPQYMPAQQSPSINFSPTIVTGGGQPAPFVGGAQPGVGGPIVGGGGAISPGQMAGAGGGVMFDPLTGRLINVKSGEPVNAGAGGKPTTATYEQTLSGLKGRFPKLPQETLEMYARTITNVPASRETTLLTLKQKNDAVKDKPKPQPSKPTSPTKTSTTSNPPLDVPPNYRGWTLGGKPYNGPEYSGYALSRSEYTSALRSGKSIADKKLRWINQTPAPPIVGDPFVDVPRR